MKTNLTFTITSEPIAIKQKLDQHPENAGQGVPQRNGASDRLPAPQTSTAAEQNQQTQLKISA